MKEMERKMELNMDELEQVNGGMDICLGFGIRYTPEFPVPIIVPPFPVPNV